MPLDTFSVPNFDGEEVPFTVERTSAGERRNVHKMAHGADGELKFTSDADPLPAGILPRTSGGLDPFYNGDVQASGHVVKASAGQIYGWYLSNESETQMRWLHFYDQATAPDETDTPLFSFRLPYDFVANNCPVQGVRFATGIAIRATATKDHTSTSGPDAGDVSATLFYK